MAAALVQGKTWRMFFIRHRQCSVYSLKLSDSCLSWTQEGPSVIASGTPALRHFWLNQKPWWMPVKSWANEVTVSRRWKDVFFLLSSIWQPITYQVSPHSGRIPLCIDGPQEAQQQGVAHPLVSMVAAVALPASAWKKNKTHLPADAAALGFDWIDLIPSLIPTQSPAAEVTGPFAQHGELAASTQEEKPARSSCTALSIISKTAI